MIFFGGDFLFIVALAISLDALVGEPVWIWRRLRHPVVLFGACISWFETHFNHPDTKSEFSARMAGLLTIACLVGIGGFFALILQELLLSFDMVADDFGRVVGASILVVIASTLIAQKSLYTHVRAIEDPLALEDIGAARQAVSMIVGRDPEKLDASGIARAGIESLAENFSDGIVAPIFWFALLGLPGLVAYKIINTADSMIGHKSDRYLHFGWASARLDDLVNFVPARLTMLLLVFSPFRMKWQDEQKLFSELWRGIVKDAPKHRSPNAGWPEAAMAGRLDVALSGPRYYGEGRVEEPFVNDTGRRDIGAAEVADALRLYLSACLVQFGVIFAMALLSL